MNDDFQTKTPKPAVPPEYFTKIERSRVGAWFYQWFLPRCPNCHLKKAREIEQHGSFMLYRCAFCEHQWRDVA
jgi:hypothetical protein